MGCDHLSYYLHMLIPVSKRPEQRLDSDIIRLIRENSAVDSE